MEIGDIIRDSPSRAEYYSATRGYYAIETGVIISNNSEPYPYEINVFWFDYGAENDWWTADDQSSQHCGSSLSSYCPKEELW